MFHGVEFTYSRENKLVFCAIPKVACLQWTRFMLLLHGKDLRNSRGGVWDGFNATKPVKMNELSPQEATEIMNDPEWKRVVFLLHVSIPRQDRRC